MVCLRDRSGGIMLVYHRSTCRRGFVRGFLCIRSAGIAVICVLSSSLMDIRRYMTASMAMVMALLSCFWSGSVGLVFCHDSTIHYALNSSFVVINETEV